MTYADLDQVMHDGRYVVLAADQCPFDTHGQGGVTNTFTVLVPLMTVEGERFRDPARTFPNRGRIWWMLTSQHRNYQVQPGSIFTALLEHGVRWDPTDPVKDRYQVKRHSLRPGVPDWCQVLSAAGPVPDPTALLRDGVPSVHPPASTVVVEAGSDLLGPFKADWDPATGTARLSATFAGDPKAYRLSMAEASAEGAMVEHAYEANTFEPDASPVHVRIRLLSKAGVRRMQDKGVQIDAASDGQVVKWGLKLGGASRKEQRTFHEALDRIQETNCDEDGMESRLARFKQICANGEQVARLGADVAAAVAEQSGFQALVKQHADELAREEIQRLVGERKAEVEKELESLRKRRDKLRKENKTIEIEYDHLKAAQERRLAEDNDAWLRDLEQRDQEIRERIKELEVQESEVESRLSGILERYENAGREIGDQLLAQLPVLRRLGLAGGGREDGAEARKPESLRLPAWLDENPERGGLSEEGFLSQFQRVAELRALVFDPEDLTNFHVALKSGLWTVLAGASGVGKTSLPRIYAEALGCDEEFLMVSVRPDWLDDRDVIGAFNPFVQRFEPAPTGLVERLVSAALDTQRGRGGIYVICLDEMNLARVEHYFAQFLSLMELPAARRKLRLYSRGVGRPNDPFAPWRQLSIGDNIRFVGTVNIDETTHFFSPKVLDRAPVLTLEAPDLSRPPGKPALASNLSLTRVHRDEYSAWIRPAADASPDVHQFLLELDQALRPIRSGLAFRLRDRILAHVASAQGLLSEDRALDFALAQSVLPRLRTGERAFGDVSADLARLINPRRFPRAGMLTEALRDGGGERDFFQLL